MKLEHKAAIVTGAGSGIGEAIALALAKEGARVALAGRGPDRLEQVAETIKQTGGQAMAVPTDVSQISDIDNLVTRTVAAYGRLDILVNSAGILISADLAGHTEKIWDDTLAVNLRGGFFLIQRAVPEMEKQGKGKIVNIASIAGCAVGSAGRAAYNASKAGVMGMTRALALELAPKKININALCPGDVETPINEHLRQDPEYLRKRVENIPWGRLGQPSDIAPAAVYLASDDSDFVHGAILILDGGFTVH